MAAERCICRGDSLEVRPVCIKGREEIPLLCNECYMELSDAGRIDRQRDAEVFGYAC